MLAIDSSSWIAYLQGEQGSDTDLVEQTLKDRQGVLPPVVLSELFSDPNLSDDLRSYLLDLPLLIIQAGYWERVGSLRAKMLEKKLKAKLADSMIVQSCVDHGVPLVSRDLDFKNFLKVTKFTLFITP